MCVLTGTVVHGKHLGRTLGFPTANVAVTPEALDCQRGVYLARVKTRDGVYAAVLNLGRHPTVPDGSPTVEAHILDFDGDLYGQGVTIELLRFLRAEIRFDSLEQLTAQIAKDAAAARAAQQDILNGAI